MKWTRTFARVLAGTGSAALLALASMPAPAQETDDPPAAETPETIAAEAPETIAAEAPDTIAADTPAGPRSRLTIRGEYVVESISQQNLFLGGGATGAAATDQNAFWTQNLLLLPRFILSDDLNINLSLDVAQGVWGFETGNAPVPSPYTTNASLATIRVDWAYLAYRHQSSRTRWYLGRQPFVLGQGLVLETDAAGLQVYRDFPSLGSSLGVGLAKLFEAGGFSDANNLGPDNLRAGSDGRDADLFFVEWSSAGERVNVRPFFVFYQDRSGGDGATLYPDRLPYLEARFQPQVTRATAFGAAAELRRGALHVDAEYNRIRGVDRQRNDAFGPFEMHDINNGDLTGANLYLRAAIVGGRFELGGTFAQGSGDPDPRTGEGNLTRIATDGSFSITEVWEDSVVPDRGYYPAGLGSPLVRGYRELENTMILQGFVGFHPWAWLRCSVAASLIRASEDLREWSDANGDGIIAPAEFGPGTSNELGSEIDVRLDWLAGERVRVTLAGGRFLPRVASSYLLFGNDSFQDAATEIRATVTVPIPEFSLGG